MHHDAITGTSRHSVVKDYMARLTTAGAAARTIMGQMSAMLLAKNVRDVVALLYCRTTWMM
jgi:hypothetical protein